MRLKILLILCCLLNHYFVTGQPDTSATRYVGMSYFGEGGLYPGFTINYERSLLANKNFELMVGARAGAYFHYRNHTGVFIMAQSGQRFRIYRRLFYEHYLGIGYLHSFLNGGDAYYVDAAGQVHKAAKTGNPHFMPSVSFGLSYSIFETKNPTRIFARPMIFWQIPFNNSSLAQFGLEIGALVKLRM